MASDTLAGRGRRWLARLRRPRGKWLWLSAALVLAAGGTATGLVLTSGGPRDDPGTWPLKAAFSLDSRYLLTTGLGGAQVIDPASTRILARWELGSPPHCPDGVDSIAMSRDDKTIVVADSGHVTWWSVSDAVAAGTGGTHRPRSALQVHPCGRAFTDVLSPDGTRLAVVRANGNGPVVVWNTQARRVAFQIAGKAVSASISADDRVMAIGRPDGLALWDITGARPRLIRVDRSRADYCYVPTMFTPQDGVVVGRQDGDKTRLVDEATGKQLGVLPTYVSTLSDTAYSMASGLAADDQQALGGTVTVTSTITGRVVARLAPPPPADNKQTPCLIDRLYFSPDGRTLVILSLAPARLWHVPA